MSKNTNIADKDELMENYQRQSDTEILHETVSDKMNWAFATGQAVEFDPEEAEEAGAFVENAMTEEDAWEARHDITA